MMLDVAAGVVIAAAICAIFWKGATLVREEEWGGWTLILISLGVTAWLVIERWPQGGLA